MVYPPGTITLIEDDRGVTLVNGHARVAAARAAGVPRLQALLQHMGGWELVWLDLQGEGFQVECIMPAETLTWAELAALAEEGVSNERDGAVPGRDSGQG